MKEGCFSLPFCKKSILVFPPLQPHFGLYLKTTIANSRMILPDHIIYINFLDLIFILKFLILVKLYPCLL